MIHPVDTQISKNRPTYLASFKLMSIAFSYESEDRASYDECAMVFFSGVLALKKKAICVKVYCF